MEIHGIEINDFLKGYITCALWSSIQEDDNPLDYNYHSSDLSLECLQSMKADCDKFQEENAEILEQGGQKGEQQGHDFWLTRNGHGAGFWDRNIGIAGEKLTTACKAYGERTLYVQDGKVEIE